MRTLAIGDIHGCRNALVDLWGFVGITSSDKVITLGDYVDRGPNSKGVIDFLIEKQEPHQSGKTMICGHSTQKSGYPKNVGHAVCIDTNVCHGGWLTCLDTESGHF